MAYTATDFAKDLALYTTGAVIGVSRSKKFAAYAAKKGIRLAGMGATRAALPVARAAAFTPAGRTLTGAAGIVAAYQAGLLDRPIEAIQSDEPFGPFGREIEYQAPFDVPALVKPIKRKVTSKFNKAIKMGMATVKKSTSFGKKGTISSPKKAFAAVTKSASSVKRTGKVAKSGIKRKIGLAIRSILR